MTFKFLKKFIYSFVIVLALITSVALSVHAADELKYLNASVGETYDTVGITWHASGEGSYLLYGTSLNGNEITNPTKVLPTETLWGLEQIGSDVESGFANRKLNLQTLNLILNIIIKQF